MNTKLNYVSCKVMNSSIVVLVNAIHVRIKILRMKMRHHFKYEERFRTGGFDLMEINLCSNTASGCAEKFVDSVLK